MGENTLSRGIVDTIVLFSLMLLTALFARYLVDFNIPPFEDAAMLMRYADHIAQGEGIVWNIGEPPVDGATDFLFMLTVALFAHFGLSIETAVRLITITSHFATVALIYIGMRKVQGSGIIPAFASAAYFAVGPGLFLSAAYFGTSYFVLAVAITWLLAQQLIFSGRASMRGYLLFSLMCLIVGLIRPEGVLISIFMLIAVIMLIPIREGRQIAVVFLMSYLFLGGTYFIWRWNYFGYPLPNPYYKKGGGYIYLSSLKQSILSSLELLYPFIPAFLLSMRSKKVFRLGIAFLIPLVGSVGMWALLSEDTNFGSRFQYPVLVIGILSWYPLVRTLRDVLNLPHFASLPRSRQFFSVILSVLAIGFVFSRLIMNSVKITYARDGRYDVGLMLRDYANHSYTIATTEAGLLPFYSKWRAIDVWGLNDQWIAHHGQITYEYLELQSPDIIMWHDYFSPLHPISPQRRESLWSRQVVTLQKYAEMHNFVLAAVFGISSDDTHYYYVNPDLSERDEIVRRIRSIDYAWYGNGEKCINFADSMPFKYHPDTRSIIPMN